MNEQLRQERREKYKNEIVDFVEAKYANITDSERGIIIARCNIEQEVADLFEQLNLASKSTSEIIEELWELRKNLLGIN